jgi:hypothetical protein
MTDRKYMYDWKHRGEDRDASRYAVGYLQHDVRTIFFVFDPYSDAPPKSQYDYSSIHEYVDYLEMALVELRYVSPDVSRKLRIDSYLVGIDEYANELERIAWNCDAEMMTSLNESDWYNPLRRIQTMEVRDAIAFLETQLLFSYSEKYLRKLHQRVSDTSYLLTLTQMAFHQHVAVYKN